MPGALGTAHMDWLYQLITTVPHHTVKIHERPGPHKMGLSKEKFTIVAMTPVGYGGSTPPPRNFTVGLQDVMQSLFGAQSCQILTELKCLFVWVPKIMFSIYHCNVLL